MSPDDSPKGSGLCFVYDICGPVGSRVLSRAAGRGRRLHRGSGDLTAATTYSLAEHDFMASGGDGYAVFTSCESMDQVLADYV